MNKKILTISILTIFSCCSCGSTSNSSNKHIIEDTWSYDEYGHFHNCNDVTCSGHHDYAYHTFNDIEEDGHYYSKCLTCGYKKHRHVYSEYQYDSQYHYKQCLDSDCQYINDKEEHQFILKNDDGKSYEECETCHYINENYVEETFKFYSIDNMQYPYENNCKNYLLGGNCEVSTYALNGQNNPNKAITIKWKANADVDKYILSYGLKEDFSDAKIVELGGKTTRYNLYNLYKNSTYYCKIEQFKGGAVKSDTMSFKTTSTGPRVLSVDGIYNVRDLGGYEGYIGQTSQGLIIRSGQLAPDVSGAYDACNITEEGKKYLSEELKVKTEIDLRSPSESKTQISESLIPNCNLVYCPYDGYGSIFTNNTVKQSTKEIFSILANPNNYPIIFHCTGGADRTGTVAYLINGYLGLSQQDLIHDYEFTTFSLFGTRSTQVGTYSSYWTALTNGINNYEGETLREKIKSYLLSIGVSEDELDRLDKIMNGGLNELLKEDEEITQVRNDKKALLDNYVDLSNYLENEVNSIKTIIANAKVSIDALTDETEMDIVIENAKGKIDLVKTKEQQEEIQNNMKKAENCFDFGTDDKLVATSNNKILCSIVSMQYQHTISMNIKTNTSDNNGALVILIGSYGFHFRGSEARGAIMDAEGKITADYRRKDNGATGTPSFDQNVFTSGVNIEMSVTFVNDLPVVSAKIGATSISYTFDKRIENEISSAAAYVRITSSNWSSVTSIELNK